MAVLQASEQKTTPRYNERRLAEQMDASGLDAVVAISPDNFYYISGSYQYSSITIRDRVAIAVVPRTGAPFLVVCSNEESNVRRYTSIQDIAFYTEFVVFYPARPQDGLTIGGYYVLATGVPGNNGFGNPSANGPKIFRLSQ